MANGPDSIFGETLAEMTFGEIASASSRGAVVLMGTGVIEQHGPHLPVATDVYLPQAILRRVRRMLQEHAIESLIAPPFYWGVNEVSASFPGTFEIRPSVMIDLIADVMTSLRKDGFMHLFCISGHGDAVHNRTLLEAIGAGRAASGMTGYFVASRDLSARLDIGELPPHALGYEGTSSPSEFLDIHAGEIETSAMLAEWPDLVRREVLGSLQSTDYELADLLEWRRGREHMRAKTPHGYFGDPASATAAFGTAYLDDQARRVATAILGAMNN